MRRTNDAFTLVEMVVTLAIVGLVTVLALGVVVNMSRADATTASTFETNTIKAALTEVLARDLAGASRQCKSTGGFGILTQVALDPQTMALRHWSAEVTYEILKLGSQSWLLRRQRIEDGSVSRELVCAGVTSITLATEPDNAAEGKWNRLGDTVKVQVRLVGNSSSEPLELTFMTGNAQ